MPKISSKGFICKLKFIWIVLSEGVCYNISTIQCTFTGSLKDGGSTLYNLTGIICHLGSVSGNYKTVYIIVIGLLAACWDVI